MYFELQRLVANGKWHLSHSALENEKNKWFLGFGAMIVIFPTDTVLGDFRAMWDLDYSAGLKFLKGSN